MQLEFLISFGIKSSFGRTPLHDATERGNIESVRFLVSKGADVNAKAPNGDTPLHRAAYENENIEVVIFLVTQGADVHAKNDNGKTPFGIAKKRR